MYLDRLTQLSDNLSRLEARFSEAPLPPRGSGLWRHYQQLREEYDTFSDPDEDRKHRESMVGKLFTYTGYPYSRRLTKGKVYYVIRLGRATSRLVCARWSDEWKRPRKTTITIHKDDLTPYP